jgi:hypothetical protein
MTTLLPLGSKSGSVFKVCYPIIRRSSLTSRSKYKTAGRDGIRRILSFAIKDLSGQG